MRRDAQDRRDRILDAAAAVFRSEGYHAPMEMVLERANVGRGTLYRNFADRHALMIALLDREIDRLAALADELGDDPEAIFHLIRAKAEIIALYPGLGDVIRAEASEADPLAVLEAKARTIVKAPLEKAKAAGLVSLAIEIDDLAWLASMVAASARRRYGMAAINAAMAVVRKGIGV